MATHAAVNEFCGEVAKSLRAALDGATAVAADTTGIASLTADIAELLATLKGKLPPSTATLEQQGALSHDVRFLRHQCEDLHATNLSLQQAVREQKDVADNAVRRLQLKEATLEGLREYVQRLDSSAAAASASSASHGSSVAAQHAGALSAARSSFHVSLALPFEVIDAVETDLATAVSSAEQHETALKLRHGKELQRQESRLRRVIDAKEKEIIQMQLYTRAVLNEVGGQHAGLLESMRREIQELRDRAALSSQEAALAAEQALAVALESQRRTLTLEHTVTLQQQQGELQYLRDALDANANANREANDALVESREELAKVLMQLNHFKSEVLPRTVAAKEAQCEARIAELLKEHEAELEAARQHRNDSSQKETELQTRVDDLERRLAIAEAESGQVRNELSLQQNAVRDLLRERKDMLARHEQYTKDLREIRLEADFLRGEVDRESVAEKGLKEKLLRLEQDAVEQLTRSASSLRAAERESDARDRQSEFSKMQLARVAGDATAAMDRANAAEKRSDGLAAELKEAQQRIRQLTNLLTQGGGAVNSSFTVAGGGKTGASGVDSGAGSSRGMSPVVPLPAAGFGAVAPGAPRGSGGASPPMPAAHAGVGPGPVATTDSRSGDPLALSGSVLSPRGGVVASAASGGVVRVKATAHSSDVGVQCILVSVGEQASERLSVRAGTRIGHDTARLEDRRRNAALRAMLVELRVHLKMPPSTEHFHAATPSHSRDLVGEDVIEFAPVPFSTTSDVCAQNDLMEAALRRRQAAWAMASRLGGRSSDVTPVDGEESTTTGTAQRMIDALLGQIARGVSAPPAAAGREGDAHDVPLRASSHSPDDAYIPTDHTGGARPTTAGANAARSGGSIVVPALNLAMPPHGIVSRPLSAAGRPNSARSARPLSGRARCEATLPPTTLAALTIAATPTAVLKTVGGALEIAEGHTRHIIDPLAYFDVRPATVRAAALAAGRAVRRNPTNMEQSDSAATLNDRSVPRPKPENDAVNVRIVSSGADAEATAAVAAIATPFADAAAILRRAVAGAAQPGKTASRPQSASIHPNMRRRFS